MASVRKSLAISFAEKYSIMVIQFISTIILARLLTPEEVGIFSVGAVIVGFAHMMRDFGVANYLVQEKELTKERIKTAFGVTLIIAWSAALALYLCSDAISNFYDESGVKNVIIILAVTFLFIPFSSTVLGLLRRDMKFGTLFWVNLLSAIAHALTGITLAFYDFGFESLAWATVASASTTVLIAIINKPDKAEFTPSLSEFRRIFSYGSYSSGSAIAQEAGLSSPDLAIGRLLGFEALGYYSRAMGLISIFNYAVTAAISPVVIPAFAKYHREGKDLKDAYLRALDYYTALAWPFFGYVLLATLPLIIVLYGDQWTPSAPIIQILCVAFMLRALTGFSGHYLIATGQVKLQFKLQVILQIPRAIITIIAAFYSLTMVALTQVLFYVACIAIFHIYVHRQMNISIIDILQAIKRSLFVSISCVAIPAVIMWQYKFDSNYAFILITGASLSLTWLACIFIFKHDLNKELKSSLNKISFSKSDS